MRLQLFQVDAFTNAIFGGNPAAVCPLTTWLPADVMQNIAMENNLAETCFYCPENNEGYSIRWFTPTTEVDLCGHATLAAAHVMFHHIGFRGDEIVFNSRSGELKVTKKIDSPRGGYLRCYFQGSHVLISGQAKTYLTGEIFTE